MGLMQNQKQDPSMQTPLICRRLIECFLSVVAADDVEQVAAGYCAVNPNIYRKVYRGLEGEETNVAPHRMTHLGLSLPRLLPPVMPAPRVRRSPPPRERSFSE